MKKAKFYIRRWNKGFVEQVFEEVDGYVHEVGIMKIGLHRNEYNKWNATHLKTGIAYTCGHPTRKDAIAFIKQNSNAIITLLANDRRLERYEEELTEYKEAQNGR